MSLCTPWIAEDARLADCGCPEGPQLVVQSAIEVASDILYRLSGQQWAGLCSETMRPVRIGIPPGSIKPFLPIYLASADILELPRSIVTDITQILIDGAAFTDFLLYNPNWVVRTDNELWPRTQRLDLATTEIDTWSITYDYGEEPPTGAQHAARILTTEIVKACVGDTNCRIPTGAVSLTRRGVTYDLSPFEGRTGIAEVDMWLSAVNPSKRVRRARIISPDDIRFVPATPVGS